MWNGYCVQSRIQLTLKETAPEVPPPGAGFTTRRFTVFALLRSTAGIATRSCPELINTVVRAEPFHVTVDPVTNCDPVMVTQVFAACAATPLGEAVETDGIGFGFEERGRTNGPRNRTTRPVPLPQKSTAVRKARPSLPQRTRSKASPASPSSSMLPIGVKRVASNAEMVREFTS